MKKVMWILAVLALVGTAVVLAFLPETVPVHFNAAWEPDRWGSRWELMILPAVLLLMAAAWKPILNVFEKKAEGAQEDKSRASAMTNVKAIGIAGITTNAALILVQGWLLLRIYGTTVRGGAVSGSILDRLPFMTIGLLFIVLGNIMPKTRRNGLIGFRVSWSMYNDETWRRTHRFGGKVMVAAGVLTVLAAALIIPPLAATVVVLVLVAAALIATLVYARRVYTEEKEKNHEV